MRLYWVQTAGPEIGHSPFGSVVTAVDENDARRVSGKALQSSLSDVDPQIRMIETMDDVEQNHVLPNMGNHLKRGVWFPKGLGDTY